MACRAMREVAGFGSHRRGGERTLESNSHELTARADAGLVKQLLERRFDRALRCTSSRGDFLVGESFEHALQHAVLAFGQQLATTRLGRALRVIGQELHRARIDPRPAASDEPDGLRQHARRVVLQEDT